MKGATPLPTGKDFGVDVSAVHCPFCGAGDPRFQSMTGGAANEWLLRCKECSSFFYALREPDFLRT